MRCSFIGHIPVKFPGSRVTATFQATGGFISPHYPQVFYAAKILQSNGWPGSSGAC